MQLILQRLMGGIALGVQTLTIQRGFEAEGVVCLKGKLASGSHAGAARVSAIERGVAVEIFCCTSTRTHCGRIESCAMLYKGLDKGKFLDPIVKRILSSTRSNGARVAKDICQSPMFRSLGRANFTEGCRLIGGRL